MCFSRPHFRVFGPASPRRHACFLTTSLTSQQAAQLSSRLVQSQSQSGPPAFVQRTTNPTYLAGGESTRGRGRAKGPQHPCIPDHHP